LSLFCSKIKNRVLPLFYPTLHFSPLPFLYSSTLLSPSLLFFTLLSPSLPFYFSTSQPFSPLRSSSLPFSPLLSPSLIFSLHISTPLPFSPLLSLPLVFSSFSTLSKGIVNLIINNYVANLIYIYIYIIVDNKMLVKWADAGNHMLIPLSFLSVCNNSQDLSFRCPCRKLPSCLVVSTYRVQAAADPPIFRKSCSDYALLSNYRPRSLLLWMSKFLRARNWFRSTLTSGSRKYLQAAVI